MTQRERDYVLGTHDEEIERLGLQHQVWRPVVLECWQKAGITIGSRVLDLGCGPGYATLDLAAIVGPEGSVTGVERSARFAASARERLRAGCAAQAVVHELDLMSDPLPGGPFDFDWSRWVCSFVSSTRSLVEKLAGALRPGGTAIFHEYADYASWRLLPRSEPFEEFVRRVMQSWRETGGEPDIALELPALLADAGFTLTAATPRILCARPGDHAWNWPDRFVRVGLRRLVDLGKADGTWAETVLAAWQEAAANPRSFVLTPLVLEIVARRPG